MKRSFTKTMKAINKLAEKRRELLAKLPPLESAAQAVLDKLARDSCPYKKGQIFKNNSSKVWAKVQMISAARIKHGAPREEYYSAPYQLDCLRCNVKGEVQKEKWMFIHGQDIPGQWALIESEG